MLKYIRSCSPIPAVANDLYFDFRKNDTVNFTGWLQNGKVCFAGGERMLNNWSEVIGSILLYLFPFYVYL